MTMPIPAAPSPAADGGEVPTASLDALLAVSEPRLSRRCSPAEVTAVLRDRLTRAIYVGALKPGDRLPSLREAAAGLGVTHYAVLKAYARLAKEGLVEARACSGTYVAPLQQVTGQPLGETAQWLAQVLEQACEHRIRIPMLPELMRRWTSAVPIRCACIATSEDDLYALRAEAEQQFGVETVGLLLPDPLAGGLQRRELPAEAGAADAWLCTALSAPGVRPLASRLGKPLVVAAMSPERVRAVRERLEHRPLTVVCVDPRFGEQLRSLFASDAPERVRVVPVDDGAEVDRVDPNDPVFLTRAARDRLPRVPFRMLVAPQGAFCRSFDQGMVALMVRLNLRDTARTPPRRASARPTAS